MPLDSNTPKNPIDALYEKYNSNNGADYATIRLELEKINSIIVNQDANIYNDSSYTSYRIGIIQQNKISSMPKTFDKDVYYGIVLYTGGYFNREVYIDIPGKSKPILNPDIFQTKENLDLSLYKEYLFTIEGFDILSNPIIGGIASVKIPKNYPNHINTNPEDAIYIGMRRNQVIVKINETSKKVSNIKGNNLSLQNAGEYQIGENLNIPSNEKIDKTKNKQNVKGYFYGEPIQIEIEQIGSYSSSDLYGETNMVKAARKMMTAYYNYKQNYSDKQFIKNLSPIVQNPKIIDGFRSSEDQQALINKYGLKRAAPLKFSNHQAGLAIDLKGTHPNGNYQGPKNNIWTEGEGFFYDWMKQYAPTYGFKRTVPSEHWHWEYRNQWANNRQGDYKGNPKEPNTTTIPIV